MSALYTTHVLNCKYLIHFIVNLHGKKIMNIFRNNPTKNMLLRVIAKYNSIAEKLISQLDWRKSFSLLT